jgi:hypothetical protein
MSIIFPYIFHFPALLLKSDLPECQDDFLLYHEYAHKNGFYLYPDAVGYGQKHDLIWNNLLPNRSSGRYARPMSSVSQAYKNFYKQDFKVGIFWICWNQSNVTHQSTNPDQPKLHLTLLLVDRQNKHTIFDNPWLNPGEGSNTYQPRIVKEFLKYLPKSWPIYNTFGTQNETEDCVQRCFDAIKDGLLFQISINNMVQVNNPRC